MSDEEDEVYAYSDDGGSDAEYAYGSDEVRGEGWRVCVWGVWGGLWWWIGTREESAVCAVWCWWMVLAGIAHAYMQGECRAAVPLTHSHALTPFPLPNPTD